MQRISVARILKVLSDLHQSTGRPYRLPTLLLLFALGCQGADYTDPGSISGPLILFHAGSLSVPIRDVSRLFMERNPGVHVKAEAAGSRDCARKISELGRACDVLASADYKVVENLVMPEHALFNIRFARNRMVLAYVEGSNTSERLSTERWWEVLLDENVAFGRSDPNRDPCGYRTVMTFQLAEKHYQIPGLAQALESKHGQKFIRPKETDLLALLEAGEIDYLFIYRSVAQQHGLGVFALPEEVDLSSMDRAALYATATVEVTGKAPGETLTRTGEPMVYSVTIPKAAPNRKAAEAFVALLVSPEGQAILERNGQPVISPPHVDGLEHLPEALRSFYE
jgi:molybdate/tungstate transport system substrate-binding protein